jgi:hypothetical protein
MLAVVALDASLHRTADMKMIFAPLALALGLASAPSLAFAVVSCADQAAAKKLNGAAQTSFVKKCESDAIDATAKSCDDQAADKKLAGAAKTSFVKKCDADMSDACDLQAANKKLAGAAKTAFTKKCVKDSTGM